MWSETAAPRSVREVTQTITYSPENQAQGIYGNCLQAAVASLLDKPLDAVPHFSAFAWWPQALTLWAYGEGLKVCGESVDTIPDRLCIIGGKSPRGVAHVCVAEHGEVVWDPHPSRDGMTTITEATWFEPYPEGETAPLLWGPVVVLAAISTGDLVEAVRERTEREHVEPFDGKASMHPGRTAP